MPPTTAIPVGHGQGIVAPQRDHKHRKLLQDAVAAAKRLSSSREEMMALPLQPSNIRSISKIQKITNRYRRVNSQSPSTSDLDERLVREAEENLWVAYGMVGEIVLDALLKECQRRVRETSPGSDLEVLREDLEALDEIHHYRRLCSETFSLRYPKGSWADAQAVPPSPQMQSKGPHFWALIIGNDFYARSPLGGCVNDAHLLRRHLRKYLGVPDDHITLLKDASRRSMIDAFYNLRDDERISPGDNILIHFSGHGSFYDARDYFTTFASQAGSIEAICPVDRGASVPDISERELNTILSEIQAEKGPNITVILDCCHSGGAVRSLSTTGTVRFIPPLRNGISGLDLQKMLEAADNNPRRRPTSPLAISETWEADLSSFVLLAACQDFQFAEESNIGPSNRSDLADGVRAMFYETSISPRHGRFTWALVKVLESGISMVGTYESLIASIGRLGSMQVPLAVGLRKSLRLWFETTQ